MKEPILHSTWTGFGHMQVFEGSTLTFDIPPLFRTMEYIPVIRYAHHPTHAETWHQVEMTLERTDGPKDPQGLCAELDDGPMTLSLGKGSIFLLYLNSYHILFKFKCLDTTFHELDQALCLEEGQKYQIHLKFIRHDAVTPNPGASIYIDSVMFRPKYCCYCFCWPCAS